MQNSQHENLFRRNAVAALAARLDGRPVAVLPRPWLWLTLVCVAFVLVAACFLWTVDYARKETVRGWLVSLPGVVSLSHSEYAVVASVARRAGEVVRRGDPVVVLTEEAVFDGGLSAAGQAVEQLRLQVVGTERREALLREQFVADFQALDDQLGGLDDEVQVVNNQRRVQDARILRKAELQFALEEAFARGALAKSELRQRKDELAELQQAAARLRRETSALARERQSLVAAQDRLGMDFERAVTRLEAERAELRQRIAAFDGQRSLTLHSPINGTVATTDVTPGSTVRPQQILASIIPQPSSLVAEVYVPSRAAGMIRPRQSVRLLYDAFPHQRFGVAHGEVDAVAGFVSLPGDMPAASGLREAAYKVTIRLAVDHVEDDNGRYALRPGMALAAEIVLESRSLLDWLLAPLQAGL